MVAAWAVEPAGAVTAPAVGLGWESAEGVSELADGSAWAESTAEALEEAWALG